MTPRVLLLAVLVLSSFFITTWSNTMCNRCCRFVEEFPGRLKKLRENYSHIQGFYEQEANDDLNTTFLDSSVEESFKTPFACHTINSILDFYLSTILPTAMAKVTDETRDLKPHMESIQQIFDQLKTEVIQCRHYFSCHKQFDMQTLNSTYTQLKSDGLYKAMGELDLLFTYIETYLASKRQKRAVRSF